MASGHGNSSSSSSSDGSENISQNRYDGGRTFWYVNDGDVRIFLTSCRDLFDTRDSGHGDVIQA